MTEKYYNHECAKCNKTNIYTRDSFYGDYTCLSCYKSPITINDYDEIIQKLESKTGFSYVVLNNELDQTKKFQNEEEGWTYLRTLVGENILSNEVMRHRGYYVHNVGHTILEKVRNKRDIFANSRVITSRTLYKLCKTFDNHRRYERCRKYDL